MLLKTCTHKLLALSRRQAAVMQGSGDVVLKSSILIMGEILP